MKRKLLVITMLAVMITGVTVGVLVWPPPKQAKAMYLPIELAFDWELFEEEPADEDISSVRVEFLDQDQELIQGPGGWLEFSVLVNNERTIWTGYIEAPGGPPAPVFLRITASSQLLVFPVENENPAIVQINWAGVTEATIHVDEPPI